MTDEEKIKQIEFLIEDVIKSGRFRLKELVSSLGEYPIVTYEDKNKHITPVVRIFADKFMELRKYNLMEIAWLNITDETDEINKHRVNKLNRGISFANTGISQIVQTKVDEGIFNLYRALADDEPILKKLGLDSNPEKNLVNNELFVQFENPIIQLLRISVLKPNLFPKERPPTFQELKDFFKKQQPSTRIFIFGKLKQLFSSIRRNEILDNMMSRQTILDALASLCIWVEGSIRRKTPAIKSLHAGLNFLNLPSLDVGFGSTDLDSLVSKIDLVKKNSNENIKRALITILIRNYAGHNLQTSEHKFFESKSKILSYVSSIFFTMLLLDSNDKI